MEELIPIILFLVIGLVLCVAFYLRYRARQEIQLNGAASVRACAG